MNQTPNYTSSALSKLMVPVIAILLLCMQYWLNHQKFEENIQINIYSYIILGFGLLLAIVLKKRKGLGVVKSFLAAHEGQAAAFFGLFNIIYVFVQLHIIGTEAHHIIAPPQSNIEEHHLLLPLLKVLSYTAFLFVPFFSQALSLRTYVGGTVEDRKVLVIGMSHHKEWGSNFDHQFNLQKICNDFIAKNPNGERNEISNFPWPLRALHQHLVICKNINKVIFLADDRANDELIRINQKKNADAMQSFLDSIREGIQYEKIYIKGVNDFRHVYQEVKDDLEEKLRFYKNYQICFNISPSTAIVSGALTLFSLRGDRGLYYLSQDNSTIEECKVNIYDLEDVISDFYHQRDH
jgi:hypothetical protein